jgi:hypothetical protein
MSSNAATYATLWDALVELEAEGFKKDAAPDWRKVMTYLRQATSRIDLELSEIAFLPESSTHYFDAHNMEDGGDVDVWDLKLDAPLISVNTITNGDGNALTTEQYTLLPVGDGPYTAVRLKANSGAFWHYNTTTGDYRNAIMVAGVWSGSNRPLRGGEWRRTGGTVKNNPLSNSNTTILTERIDEKDAFYGLPRFSPGMRLRLVSGGNTEYVDLAWLGETSAPTDAHQLMVERGTGGTTAVQHVAATVIEAWYPDANIVRACARLAAYYYKRRARFAGTESDPEAGTINKYGELPPDVAGILAKYQSSGKARPRIRIGAI